MKYTNTVIFFIVAVVMVLISPASTFAFEIVDSGTPAATVSAPTVQDPGPSAATLPAPVIQDSGTPAGSLTTPTIQDPGTPASTLPTPVIQDSGTPAGTLPAPVIQDPGASAGSVTPAPSTPATPSSGGSTGGGSSSSGGGYSSGGSSAPVNSTSCQLLTNYMSLGGNNNSADVTKLQTFLKNVEGINVNITGIFDVQTEQAVMAFQTKYASDTLAPWGATTPTGHVFLTTLKKINARACNTSGVLTSAELAEIAAYKTADTSATVSNETIGMTDGTTVGSTTNGTSTDDTQVAAAVKTPFFTKMWNFVKWIFGR